MSYTPQHDQNPFLLNEAEAVPAKIWELLRRNVGFQKVVARLKAIDARTPGQLEHPGRCPHEIGIAMMRRLAERHGFGHVALQWLVPEPFFAIHEVDLPTDFDPTGRAVVSLKTVTLQEGTTPNPEDLEHWKCFVSDEKHDAEFFANLQGRRLRRGPMIHFQTSADPRLRDQRDPIKEWRDYFSRGRTFSLTTPWRDAPRQFKRDLCFMWRQIDTRSQNPITGNRIDCPTEHETRLFDGWRLADALWASRVEAEDMARAIMFDDLARNYRVFAIPHAIQTRSEARRVADWLFDRLAANLPGREREVLGSPLQWDILLTVEKLIAEGAPLDEALSESFELLHLRAHEWQEGQPVPDQKKGWAQRGTDWENAYRAMNAPGLGKGLVQRIFPARVEDLVLSSSITTA